MHVKCGMYLILFNSRLFDILYYLCSGLLRKNKKFYRSKNEIQLSISYCWLVEYDFRYLIIFVITTAKQMILFSRTNVIRRKSKVSNYKSAVHFTMACAMCNRNMWNNRLNTDERALWTKTGKYCMVFFIRNIWMFLSVSREDGHIW